MHVYVWHVDRCHENTKNGGGGATVEQPGDPPDNVGLMVSKPLIAQTAEKRMVNPEEETLRLVALLIGQK